jgi:NADH-quinone oxidoreductase subunit C
LSTDGPTAAPASTDDAAAEAAPVDAARDELLALLTAELGDAIVDSHVAVGHGLWVRVTLDAWRPAAEVAKAKAQLTFFDFLSAIDWMPSPFGRYEIAVVDEGMPAMTSTADIEQGVAGGETRFQMLTHLVDVRERRLGVFFKADVPDDDLRVPSLVPVFAGAAWHERECWEMFGIGFDGNPDIRHLYLPTEFEGFPLRKDYPLVARLVKPWPGIVDVEPMPGGAAADDEEATTDAEGGDP